MNKSKHEIVKDYIIDKISSRIYSEGSLIESESVLCKNLNVSRMTVRGALDELVNEGVVFKIKGSGTFVKKRSKYAGLKCGASFSDEIRKRNMVPSNRSVEIEKTVADEKTATMIGLNIGDAIWKISRVRCADGIPIQYSEECYPYSLCPELSIDIAKNSIYQYLSSIGIKFSFSDRSLEAILASKNVAKKLDITEGHPLIMAHVVAYTQYGLAFNFGVTYNRTDTLQLAHTVEF